VQARFRAAGVEQILVGSNWEINMTHLESNAAIASARPERAGERIT
jgi:hypothetical protein